MILLNALTARDLSGITTIRVVRERDLEGFEVCSARDHVGRYYTIRNDTHWRGYKTCTSLAQVRQIIREA